MTSDLAGSSSSPISRGPVCEAGEGLGSELAGAGQNNIIQKPKTQVEGSCGSSVGKSRLQGEREKHGAKRVSLLDPTTGLHDIVGKEETRRRPVTPVSPASNLWQMRASLTEHRRAVDSIEGVAKSQFEKDFIRMACSQCRVTWMAGSVSAGKLQGPQVVPRLLPDQATEHFPNSNGPHPPVRLGEGVQGQAAELLGDGPPGGRMAQRRTHA